MSKVVKGVTRAFGLNEGGTLNRALGGNSGMAAVIGLVAAIAIPFAAPAIAGAILGSTAVTGAFVATSAAVGAGLGAAAGAVSGSLTGNMGQGALYGGAGGAVGGFLGGGGLGYTGNALFGPSGTVVPATGQPISAASYETLTGTPTSSGMPSGFNPGAAQAPAAVDYGAFGQPVQATPGIGGAAAAAPTATVAPTSAGAAAPTGGGVIIPTGGEIAAGSNAPSTPTGSQFERFVGGLTGSGTKMDLSTAEGVGRAASGLVSPSGIAGIGQLAVTMYNKPPEGLTAQERAYLNETANLASTNRAVYEQRVDAARQLLNQGTPNPEQAYAQSSLAYQRRAREAGLRSPEDVRRTMIDATRAGAAAVPAEFTRSYSATQAGLSAMPTSVPAGAESYALQVQRDAERRQREYQASLSQSVGTLAGALGGSRNKGLFG